MLRISRCKSVCSIAGFAIAVLWPLALSPSAFADPASQPQGVGSREVWVGVDAGSHNWLVYSGATYAPFDDIHGDGWRLRTGAGYGSYTYQWDVKTRVEVAKSTADVLIGYQYRIGPLTAKGFVGAALLSDLDVISAHARRASMVIGAKGSIELWLNLGDAAFTSLDIAYADTRDAASVRSRTGYRVIPTVSLGLETAVNHTNLARQVQIEPHDPREVGNVRVGAFARYEWFGGEISAAVGVMGDIKDDLKTNQMLQRPQPYGTLNWITQF